VTVDLVGGEEAMSAMEQVHIPEKLFYKINEVATITKIKPYVLRYWESEFPMLSPEKDENDQRRYRKADIELVLQIKRLLYEEKFTIAGARKQLKGGAGKAEPAQAKAEAPAPKPAAPVKVNLDRYRRLNTSLLDLRGDVEELYKILA
jgi:DNA-binding transcriptional MerR regulator